MPTRNEFDQCLDALARYLQKRPMSARDIMEEFNCCKVTAYKRLAALRARGYTIERGYPPKAPQGERTSGPQPTLYRIKS